MKAIINTLLLCTIGTAGMAQSTPESPERLIAAVQVQGANEAKTRNSQPKEYRFKKTSGKVLLLGSKVTVDGYDGQEVVVTRWSEPVEYDARAAGLQGINSTGLKDNTGLGIHLSEADGNAVLSVLNVDKVDSLHIKLPRQLGFSIKAGSKWVDGGVQLRGLSSEVEVASTFGDVKLERVSGPMTIKTVQGNIEAVLSTSIKGPISFLSTLGFVDVAVSTKTAANLELRTTLGEIFAADELNIKLAEPIKKTATYTNEFSYVNSEEIARKVEKGLEAAGLSDSLLNRISQNTIDATTTVVTNVTSEFPALFISSGNPNRVQGTINGGGENIIIRTTQGKIYLRTSDR